MIYWLKTGVDIQSSGYGYDGNCFPLDSNVSSINMDTPERKYQTKKIIGNGASVSGGDSYADRVITISRVFKNDGSSVSGALTAGRTTFINKFIASYDSIYLIRNYNGSLQYIKVIPVLGNEKYKKLIVSESFDIKLLCELPFFKAVAPTVTSVFQKNAHYFDYSFTNDGVPTPVIFSGTFAGNDTELKLGVYNNYGVDIVRNFITGDIVTVDSSDLSVYINNVQYFNLVITGTPFNALAGASTLRIESVTNIDNCTLTYTGRYL